MNQFEDPFININSVKILESLADEISKNKFREDLFYRLNVVPLYVPSLCERKEDIIYLTKYFIEKFNEKYGKNIEYADNDSMDILMNYDWPGNIK